MNLVDFYYRHTDKNAILMFIFICFLFPLLFMNVAGIADKYLAVGMQDLSERFNLSPTLAAVTLIAFANGAPDMLSNSSSGKKEGGALLSLGSCLGGLIFATTMVASNVIFSSKKMITFPKLPILKELGFISLIVVWLVVFSFIGSTGIPFLCCYLGTYTVYIILTVIVEKMASGEEAPEDDLEGELNDSDQKPGDSDML